MFPEAPRNEILQFTACQMTEYGLHLLQHAEVVLLSVLLLILLLLVICIICIFRIRLNKEIKKCTDIVSAY